MQTYEELEIDLREVNIAEYNPRKHLQKGDIEYEQLEKSIDEFGYVQYIVYNKATNNIVGGNQKAQIFLDRGTYKVKATVIDEPDLVREKALNIGLNNIHGEWDTNKLNLLLEEISSIDTIDIEAIGFTQEELDNILAEMNALPPLKERLKDSPPSNLFDTFVIPPFSVLDTKQGYWQERKKQWLELGIKSEVGREDNLVFNKSIKISENDNGTSIFDPVLCEICYRWFNIDNGIIIDPFAGGSVRGIVASILNYNYTGIDLRQEQIDSNYKNAEELGITNVNWICDDSLNIGNYIKDETADLLFTCPPYFDLEQYSNDSRDISNMDYDSFSKIYTDILTRASRKLKNNRFAIVVISDVRDKKGFYHDLTGLTKQIFKAQGINLYNDLILHNVVGSAALRARKNMRNRKVVRTHQNVLVFYKGNPKDIQKEFKELTELESLEYVEEYQEL